MGILCFGLNSNLAFIKLKGPSGSETVPEFSKVLIVSIDVLSVEIGGDRSWPNGEIPCPPAPIPRIALPLDTESIVEMAEAVRRGFREYGFVTPVARLIRFVLSAATASIAYGFCLVAWSAMKKVSKSKFSAQCARETKSWRDPTGK